MKQKSSKLDISHYQVNVSLNQLISFYETRWPCDEDEILEFIAQVKQTLNDESLFQMVLARFKKHVNGSAGKHPSRYSSINFGLGVRWVFASEEFKSLVKIIDQYQTESSFSILNTVHSLFKGISNLPTQLVNHPLQSLVVMLSMQNLANALTIKGDSMDFAMDNNYQFRDDQCPYLVRKGNIPDFSPSYPSDGLFRDYHSNSKYDLSTSSNNRVILFGESHDDPYTTQWINSVFPAFASGNFSNFAYELPTASNDKMLTNEEIRLYRNIEKNDIKVNYIDDDEIVEYLVDYLTKREKFNKSHFSAFEAAIQNTLPARDKFMAERILTTLTETNQNVFVLVGRNHAGLAWHLLKSGCEVIFVSEKFSPALNTFEEDLRKEFQQLQKVFKSFKYIELIPEEGNQFETIFHIMKAANPDTTVNQAKHSLFWHQYRYKQDPYSIGSPGDWADFEDNTPPDWDKIARDAKLKKNLYFFNSHSKDALSKLGYIDQNDNCNPEKAPVEFCEAWNRI